MHYILATLKELPQTLSSVIFTYPPPPFFLLSPESCSLFYNYLHNIVYIALKQIFYILAKYVFVYRFVCMQYIIFHMLKSGRP